MFQAVPFSTSKFPSPKKIVSSLVFFTEYLSQLSCQSQVQSEFYQSMHIRIELFDCGTEQAAGPEKLETQLCLQAPSLKGTPQFIF